MNSTTVHDVTIEFVVGDITNQSRMDAVVNAANAQLRIGGGVAGAIHRVAGPVRLESVAFPAILTGAFGYP